MDIRELGPYYEWADKKIINLLRPLGEYKFNRNLDIDITSIRNLCEHIVAYYELIINNSKNLKFAEILVKLNDLSQEELLNYWETIVQKFSKEIKSFENRETTIPISKDETITVPFQKYLFAYTDHASYHRGQIMTIYKVVTGEEGITTDYFNYLIEQYKQD